LGLNGKVLIDCNNDEIPENKDKLMEIQMSGSSSSKGDR
jgi:hypothetical protein